MGAGATSPVPHHRGASTPSPLPPRAAPSLFSPGGALGGPAPGRGANPSSPSSSPAALARLAFTLAIISAWYASNIGVLLLNKWLLSSTPFRQPVFLTLCHMLACAALGYLLSLGELTPIRPLRSRRQLAKLCALSALFCTTIVLGNLSLKHIPVSFNQMLGSMTPFFTAVFAALLMGSRETPLTYLTLAPVVGGVALASGAEPSFHLVGFCACVAATAGRALKSVVQAMLLTDASEKLDPMSLLFYMSCFSVLLLLPATAVLEPAALATTRALVEASPGFFWWLLGNSCLAYAVNLSNFLVTKYTSALTLQVLGNCKGVIAAFVSVLMFKNVVTPRGCLGYALTVAGVFLYSESKRRGKGAAAQQPPQAGGAQQGSAVGAGGGGSAVGSGAGGGSAAGLHPSPSGKSGEAGGGGGGGGGAPYQHHAALLKALVGGKGSDGGVGGVGGGGGGGGGGAGGGDGIVGALGGIFAPALKGRSTQGAAVADVESVALLGGAGGDGGAGGGGGGGGDRGGGGGGGGGY